MCDKYINMASTKKFQQNKFAFNDYSKNSYMQFLYTCTCNLFQL